MKEIVRSKLFKKDFKLAVKRGKNPKKFELVIDLLISNSLLPQKYKNHKLSGDYKGFQELHIEPDWLLIYMITKNAIMLERTGTHSDLFKK